jgi:hypothetical protein
MNYSKLSPKQLSELHTAFVIHGNLNAAREVAEFQKLFNKQVQVVKGRKVPIGTRGIVFWVKRYDNSKYGDPWGIYSNTRIGFKDVDGNVYFTSYNNVELV